MADIGVITPLAGEDVQFSTNVQWAGTPGVATLTWTLDSGLAGDLAVSADSLSAKLVTAGGNFSANLKVSSPDGSVFDTATISRQAGVITAIGLSASVVPKA